MKKQVLVLVGLLSAIFAVAAQATTIDEFVAQYTDGFNSDGTGMVMSMANFEGKVPVSQQEEVLSKMLDQALAANPPNYRVVSRVILFLGDLRHEIVWSQHLESVIYAQIKSPDGDVRGCTSMLLGKKQKDKARSLVLSLQNDPDDAVRVDFIYSIEKWPDAGPIISKYIHDHESDPKYADSVRDAKDSLRINQELFKK
jgi:hypothetical protein